MVEEESWVNDFFERTSYSNPILYPTGPLTDPHTEKPQGYGHSGTVDELHNMGYLGYLKLFDLFSSLKG